MGLERHRIGHHAEKTDERKAKADARANAEGDDAESGLKESVVAEQILEPVGMGKGRVGVHIIHDLTRGQGKRSSIGDGSHQDGAVAKAAEGVRNKDFRKDRLAEPYISAITDDAHDLEIGVMGRDGNLIEHVQFDGMRDGVVAGEILAGKRIVDHGNTAGGDDVRGG